MEANTEATSASLLTTLDKFFRQASHSVGRVSLGSRGWPGCGVQQGVDVDCQRERGGWNSAPPPPLVTVSHDEGDEETSEPSEADHEASAAGGGVETNTMPPSVFLTLDPTRS
ncbi:hypothetical protein KIN20_028768 [Parelaphostrongylus tenuis]|uniref:Uncharacterized protein n=1 Tax=Parelaphostrongylus tenuis TaxID=148309 RepID=A0AAD5WFB7_PARTN|nr:hypothetical protein KIN20_028768 [Parelaphostrongylus tenuis]